MANGFASPEHRGPSDEQILAELLSQGPEGRPAAEAPIQQPSFLSRLGSVLGEPQETSAGQMNLLQALGLGLQDISRGLQGQPLQLPQMAQRRSEQLQQESQFQRELSAGFERLERQQTFEREMNQLNRDMELLRETGVVSPALQQQMESSGLGREEILSMAKAKLDFNKLSLDIKRAEAGIARAKEKALKDPATRDFLLGIKQPPTAAQAAMLKWFDKLPEGVQAKLAPMVLGGLDAKQMLFYHGLLEGKSVDDLLALLTGGDSDPELAALTKFVTAMSTAISGGLPLPEEVMGVYVGALRAFSEKLKIKRPATKAESIEEAKSRKGQLLDIPGIIEEYQKRNPGQLGRGGGGPRF